jgi:uncharacterized metal-binding protein
MADADAHDTGVKVAAGATLAAGLALTHPIAAAVTAIACWVGGHYISGDIDLGLNGRYTPRPVRRLQRVGLWWFWSPFSNIRHRHILSHLPGLCTIIKLLWVSWPVWVVAQLIGHAYLLALWYYPDGPHGGAALTLLGFFLKHIFIGLAIADLTHWIQDGFPVHI